jgi:hypothetical protein
LRTATCRHCISSIHENLCRSVAKLARLKK